MLRFKPNKNAKPADKYFSTMEDIIGKKEEVLVYRTEEGKIKVENIVSDLDQE